MSASRAGYHKQKISKKKFTAMRHRGPMGFLTVRQLGKSCAYGAISRPVLNTGIHGDGYSAIAAGVMKSSNSKCS